MIVTATAKPSNFPLIIVKTRRERLPASFISKTLDISQKAALTYRHPGTTEIEIIDYVLKNYSIPNQTVLDPLCGVGTFVKRSLELGRNAYGCETVSEYAKLANAAINNLMGGTDRVRNISALKLARIKEWNFQFNLCFFSPPLLNLLRGKYPESEHQIGNYGIGEESLWLKDLKKVMMNISHILEYDGYLAINWKNQQINGIIIPLAYWGVIAAINIGYTLVDEKLITFDLEPNRTPEYLHIFKYQKSVL